MGGFHFGCGFLFQEPAPEDAVRGFFAVNLDVEPAVMQVLDLGRGEVDGSGDRAADGLRSGEVGDGGAADTGGYGGVEIHRSHRGFQPFEGSGERELGAFEGGGGGGGAGEVGAGAGVGGDR